VSPMIGNVRARLHWHVLVFVAEGQISTRLFSNGKNQARTPTL
jgi:hypothetical protein